MLGCFSNLISKFATSLLYKIFIKLTINNYTYGLQALTVVSYRPALGALGALALPEAAAAAPVHWSPVGWACNRARDYS